MSRRMMSQEQVTAVIASVRDYALEAKMQVVELVMTVVAGDMPGFQTRQEVINKIGHHVFQMEHKLLEQGYDESLIAFVKECFCTTILQQSQELTAKLTSEQRESFEQAMRSAFGLDIDVALQANEVEKRVWRERVNKAIDTANDKGITR